MGRTSSGAKELKSVREKIDRHFKKLPTDRFSVLVPNNLTSDTVYALKPTSLKVSNERWKGAVYIILHFIIVGSLEERFKGRSKYIPLKLEVLRENVGQLLAGEVLKALVQAKIIACDGKSSIGVESFGYKLTGSYAKSSHTFKTITESCLVRKHEACRYKLYTQQKLELNELAHLTRWFLYNTLEIDTQGALNYLDDWEQEVTSNIYKSGIPFEKISSAKLLINNSVESAKASINRWNSELKLTVDTSGKRLFTPLVNLMSGLRHFLTHRGEELVYLDIRNSQPFHLLIITQLGFWNAKGEINLKEVDEKLETFLQKRKTEEVSNTIKMVKEYEKLGYNRTNKGLQRADSTRPRYAYLVATGKLYKFIHENFRGKFVEKNGNDPFGTEKSTKIAFIRLFYFNPKEKYSSSRKHFAEFKKLFPVEAAVIETLKKRKHNDFSLLLQTVEADILLRTVALRVFRENNSVPIYTIHDGILTTREHFELLKSTIIETYREIIGVEPELSFEVFNPENAKKNLKAYAERKASEILNKLKIHQL